MSGSEGQDRPVLRIVRGAPTDEEIAALVAVVAAASAAPDDDVPAEDSSRWASPGRLLRQPVAPTGWWASGLPR